MDSLGIPMRLEAGHNIDLTASGDGLIVSTDQEASAILDRVAAASVPSKDVTLTAAELQNYINELPRYLSETVHLTMYGEEITQPLVLDSFLGPGYLSLSGEGAEGNLKLKKGIIINHCTAMIQIYNCELSGISVQSNPDICANVYNSRSVSFVKCCFAGSNNSNSCALNSDCNSQVILNECMISSWNRAVLAMNASIVDARGCTCSGNTYGAQVWGGGIVLLSGATPELMGGASNLLHGGMIVKADGTPYAPLEWHDLPLIEGWIAVDGYSVPKYTRTPWGFVMISSGTIRKEADDYSIYANPIVARMPEGYRPQMHMNTTGAVYELQGDTDRTTEAVHLIMDKNGYIQLQVRNSARANRFVFSTTIYQAALSQ